MPSSLWFNEAASALPSWVNGFASGFLHGSHHGKSARRVGEPCSIKKGPNEVQTKSGCPISDGKKSESIENKEQKMQWRNGNCKLAAWFATPRALEVCHIVSREQLSKVELFPQNIIIDSTSFGHSWKSNLFTRVTQQPHFIPDLINIVMGHVDDHTPNTGSEFLLKQLMGTQMMALWFLISQCLSMNHAHVWIVASNFAQANVLHLVSCWSMSQTIRGVK